MEIAAGEPPYDIYVRWKSLREQPIGWNPDLNDGVRLNIRPFVTAGVLRSKVNVKWEKDRGKNPDGSERHNDKHLTVAEKQVLTAKGVIGARLSCQITCTHDMVVRAISRFGGSGRPDPGPAPAPTITPPPEWIDRE